LEIDKTS